ncbi:MAG TPA: sensor domain-containing diguanylate cyclase [Deltaproteobacteria bacterium]|nr:sensor domain-containing diguanylate cyclase [Deltaproteobacteria bacterium]
MKPADAKGPGGESEGAADGGSGHTRWTPELDTLVEVGKAVTSSLDITHILKVVMEKISELFRPSNWSLLLLDERSGELTFEIVVGEGAEKIRELRLKPGEGIAGWVAREGVPLLVPDVATDPRFCGKIDRLAGFSTKSVVCVPLKAKGRCQGVIELINSVESFTEDDLRLLSALADYTAIAIENAKYLDKVEELTITDDLTGLYNTRHLHSCLEYEVERARRYEYDVSMIFLDIDSFKSINDRYGHLRGSRLLCEAGSLIRKNVRSADIVCRYGGDEFVVLLPQTSKKNAMAAAEKLREALRSHSFLRGDGLDCRITASFGVASFPADAKDKYELISLADRAMYKIKNLTKDGVSCL